MFRMDFDQKLVENVEEHSLSVFMHAHVSGLRTHTYSCVRGLCSCVRVHVLQFIRTHVHTCILIAQSQVQEIVAI